MIVLVIIWNEILSSFHRLRTKRTHMQKWIALWILIFESQQIFCNTVIDFKSCCNLFGNIFSFILFGNVAVLLNFEELTPAKRAVSVCNMTFCETNWRIMFNSYLILKMILAIKIRYSYYFLLSEKYIVFNDNSLVPIRFRG